MATETLARGASLDIVLRIPVGFADGYLAGWVPTSQIRTLSDQLIATLNASWVDPDTTRYLRLRCACAATTPEIGLWVWRCLTSA